MIIKHKNSFSSGLVPSASEIQYGEIAINISQGKLFIKKGDSEIDPGEMVDVGGELQKTAVQGGYAFGISSSVGSVGSVPAGFDSVDFAIRDQNALVNDTGPTGAGAFVLGANPTASGLYSIATGYNSVSRGTSSSAFGYISEAASDYSFASGIKARALGIASSAFGAGSVAENENTTAVGQFNDPETGSIFEVGIGGDDLNRQNAFVIYKSGEIVAPGLSIEDIDDSSSRVLVTKEYMNSTALLEPVIKTIGPTGDFPDFQEAQFWLDSKTFSAGANVVFNVQNGTHYFEVGLDGYLLSVNSSIAKVAVIGSGSTVIHVSQGTSPNYSGCFFANSCEFYARDLTTIDDDNDTGFIHVRGYSAYMKIYSYTAQGGERFIKGAFNSYIITWNVQTSNMLVNNKTLIITETGSSGIAYGSITSTQTNSIKPFAVVGATYGSSFVLQATTINTTGLRYILEAQHGVSTISAIGVSFTVSDTTGSFFADDGSSIIFEGGSTPDQVTYPSSPALNTILPNNTMILFNPTNHNFTSIPSTLGTTQDIDTIGNTALITKEYLDNTTSDLTLDDLSGVDLTGAGNGDVLAYDANTDTWIGTPIINGGTF